MREVEAKELTALAMRALTVFDEPSFAALNARRANRIVHLVLGEPAARLALVAGIRDNRLRAPFSAPWSLPLLGKARPRIADYQHAADDLAANVGALGVDGIDLVVPSPHLAPDTVAKWSAALALTGFRSLEPDLSFHLEVPLGEGRLDPKARQKLVAARKHPTTLTHGTDDGALASAYEVVAANRVAHGYPLHMTLEDILATRSVVPVDALTLAHDGQTIAAAICYRLTADLAYVVYWGDIPDGPVPHVMNLLAAEVLRHYGGKGFRILDTGTASVSGKPQHGLADFKQSLGAIASLRGRFTLP